MSPVKKARGPASPAKRVKAASTDFSEPPPPVPARDIKETITADVVVIGAGIAGLTAAVSAAEAGARAVLLEKGPGYNYRGLHNAAIASRLQKQAGIQVDKEQLIYTIMETGAYRGDQRVIKMWADNCDRVMDWLLDLAEAAGIRVALDTTTKPWYFPNYPIIHVFDTEHFSWQASLARMLVNNARARGVEFRFETPAVQLLRKGKGRVTGVIARNKAGDYLQFNAGRAVVLCTGDYGSDRRMVEKYCWKGVSEIPSLYPRMTDRAYAEQHIAGPYDNQPNTGDGHKMGLWIGAAIDNPPHCTMLFDYTLWSGEKLFDLARQPWLYVNANGERFMNEDLPWGYECSQLMQQPGNIAWSIWDAKYDREWPKMQSQCCKNMGPPTYLWNPKWLGEAVEEGNVLTADTIEGLAVKMNVPVEAFKTVVARYNDIARQGKDLDFGKHPDRLTTVEKPLFYAAQVTAVYLVILGGLKINPRLQVIDTEEKVIPGLYAAGNVSGSFFGSQYPTTAPGLSHSRAWTFGRLAGISAAAEKQ
jgi:fumarate reductase flavoprotein subunit